jgi:hypothetical protein
MTGREIPPNPQALVFFAQSNIEAPLISAVGDVAYLRREKPQVAQREYYSGPGFAP